MKKKYIFVLKCNNALAESRFLSDVLNDVQLSLIRTEIRMGMAKLVSGHQSRALEIQGL